MCVQTRSLQSCLTLCNPTDNSPPGSSVQEIPQARILEWAAITSPGLLHCRQILYNRVTGSPSPLTYEPVSCELSKVITCLHLSTREWLPQLSCTILRSGPVPHLLTVPPQLKKIPLMFPVSWIASVLQQYQLHHWCVCACFQMSWAWNNDTVLLCPRNSKVRKSTCSGCMHVTIYARHVN